MDDVEAHPEFFAARVHGEMALVIVKVLPFLVMEVGYLILLLS